MCIRSIGLSAQNMLLQVVVRLIDELSVIQIARGDHQWQGSLDGQGSGRFSGLSRPHPKTSPLPARQAGSADKQPFFNKFISCSG